VSGLRDPVPSPDGAAVREMTEDDASWAAALMERRRQVYASYSPVFWRPRPGVTGFHARFLRRLISAPDHVALRGEHGFIIGQRRSGQGFVDDFAVEQTGSWDTDGAELLLAAWQRLSASGCTTMRVVTANADTAKSGMLRGLSLRLAEQWWVHELTPANRATAAQPPANRATAAQPPANQAASGRVSGTGFSGTLGPAPPVYDPGGPVLLADSLDAGADLGMAGREASVLGAVLLIVPAAPGTPRSAELDRTPGWNAASDWYDGQPSKG
jgi:hypothetical protein